MDRTKKLLVGFTASVLLSGGSSQENPTIAQPPVFIVNPQTPEDAKVTETIRIISQVLYGVPEQNALTLNELLAKRPELTRRYAETAIQDLLRRGEIRRTGDGTPYKPYRYYDRYRSSRRGGG